MHLFDKDLRFYGGNAIVGGGLPTAVGLALADHLQRLFKEQGLGKIKVEGLPHCDWVLLDAGDVIVHLFRPEVRSFYNLERMWSFGDAPTPEIATH